MRFLRSLLPWAVLGLIAVAHAQDEEDDGDIFLPPPGDLANGATSPVAQQILQILQGTIPGENNTKDAIPNPCPKKNKCCSWYKVTAKLNTLFVTNGKCNDKARASIRLGFHDAGTWSRELAAKGQDYGGADGSIFLFQEYTRPENAGLEAVAVELGKLAKANKVGYGDMFQFASAHATVICDLGPRMRTFVGRKDATRAAPDGLLPDVHAAPEKLDALFQDKTISPHDLAALLGAHSVGKQFKTDPAQSGKPLDLTPEVWDVEFYKEILDGPANGTFHLPSDVALANYGPVNSEWVRFVGDQHHWNDDYAKAFIRLSLLGVNNINTEIYECTDALPAANYKPGEEGEGEEEGDEGEEGEEEEGEEEEGEEGEVETD